MQVNGTNRLPYVITITQQKGGVGKTTITANLGAGLAEEGKKCLLLDLASSGNLTAAFGCNPDSIKRTTSDLFQNTHGPSELIQSTPVPGLSLIPANASLSAVHRLLYQEPNYELKLNKILAQKFFSEFDILILDCPPGLDSININAIASAELAILPVICDVFSLQTLNNMFRLIQLARERANPDLAYRLLINKMNPEVPLHKKIVSQIKSHYQSAILNTVIHEDDSIPESQISGGSLLIDQPESQTARQFRTLSNEILSLEAIKKLNNQMKKVKP